MKECGAAVCGGGGRRGGAATAPIAQQTALDYECMTGRGGGGGGGALPGAPRLLHHSPTGGLCQNVHFYTYDKIRFCARLPATEIKLQLKAEL